MTRDDKIKLFKRIHELNKRSNDFLDSLPISISDAFSSNYAIESLSMANDALIDAAFGNDAESVFWFLHEWEPGYEVGVGDKTTKIHSIEEYIAWIVENEKFGENNV